MNDEERKQWGARAEVVCSTSIQVSTIYTIQHNYNIFLLLQEFNQQQESNMLSLPSNVVTEENIVEKTLLNIQEKVFKTLMINCGFTNDSL